MGSPTTPDAATDLPPLKGPIFLYLTDLKIESMDCAKVAEAIKSTSKESVIFFIVLILGVVRFVLNKSKFKLNKNYLAFIQEGSKLCLTIWLWSVAENGRRTFPPRTTIC